MLLRQQQAIKRAGFTLMEIMVVVAIILILASAGVVVTQSMLGKARINRAKTDIKSWEAVVSIYNTNHGRYPDTLEQLTLRDPVDNTPALMEQRALMDPWSQPYFYDASARHELTGKPRIWSNGPPETPLVIDNWGTGEVIGR